MGISTAERNRRKREKKKKSREERQKHDEKLSAIEADSNDTESDAVEIEYVAEELKVTEEFDGVRRLQERIVAVIADEERHTNNVGDAGARERFDNEEEDDDGVSKRKLRELLRPSVADLKRRVKRPDLVEAHDVTAADPDFLIQLKAVPGTVPVPRHWGRKRKYLQGKRGFEKQPFQLPDFIVKTGITEVRDGILKEEANQSAKQKNRSRVAPKLGAIDIDYNAMHAAFFKQQTKPKNLTKFGDLYYEGKELEVKIKGKPGGPLSEKLREALGMTAETDPPPWLMNFQRYGPPPSYPGLRIPGLNAPLPNSNCQYGFHPGGWGKPPVDAYGRPLYGGNPFDAPGTKAGDDALSASLVTSDGKTICKTDWGALPMAAMDDEESQSDDEISSGEEMEESDQEEEIESEVATDGAESILLPPSGLAAPTDLRKQTGDETPMLQGAPRQLYQVVDEIKAPVGQGDAVFASESAYVVPGMLPTEGAESVLSKAVPQDKLKRKAKKDEDDADLGKNFKF
jgi:splicing factor 3B subunit 2